MTPRHLFLTLLAFAVAAALLPGCGGGGGRPSGGQLTDPRDVATATPWPEPPEVTFLEPGATPAAGGGTEGEGTPAAAAECGETYTVQSGDVPSAIAEKCGVTTADLLEANPGIDPKNIHAGDVLKVPRRP